MDDWKPVTDVLRGGFFDGFDRDAELAFKRGGSENVQHYRLSDQPDWFNVANLFWRLIPGNSKPRVDHRLPPGAAAFGAHRSCGEGL